MIDGCIRYVSTCVYPTNHQHSCVESGKSSVISDLFQAPKTVMRTRHKYCTDETGTTYTVRPSALPFCSKDMITDETEPY